VDIDIETVFTRPLPSKVVSPPVSKGFFRRWLSRVQPVYVVGRPVVEGQALDNIIDALSRLKIVPFIGEVDIGASWDQLALGEYAIATTGEVAGNAVSSLPTVSATEVQLYEVEAILHTLDCDATAASRVPTVNVNLGVGRVSPWLLNDFAISGATSTANEDSSLLIPRAPGLVQINDNGTFTTADSSPLPLPLTTSGLISATVAAGVAGDVHQLTALVRRVA